MLWAKILSAYKSLLKNKKDKRSKIMRDISKSAKIYIYKRF